MSGQTFRENVSQDLCDLLDRNFGRVWPIGLTKAHGILVDWAVQRFCPDEAPDGHEQVTS